MEVSDISKINTPYGRNDDIDLTFEAVYLSTLLNKSTKTKIGLAEFTSETSGITYSTNDSENPNIYNKGETGLILLLWEIFGKHDSFQILANDINALLAMSEVLFTLDFEIDFLSDAYGAITYPMTKTKYVGISINGEQPTKTIDQFIKEIQATLEP